jgi:hypothetical protein
MKRKITRDDLIPPALAFLIIFFPPIAVKIVDTIAEFLTR